MKKFFPNKILVLLFSVFFLNQLHAELGDGNLLFEPRRFFEFGIDSSSAFANSSFGLHDFMKKELEIDLQKISKEMPAEGFSLAFYNRETVFVNLNVNSRFRFSFFGQLESSSYFSISKDLFDLLADGISIGESKTVDVTGYADIFYNMGASFQTIIKDFGVKITSTYFVPILYIPKTTATASLKTSASGAIKGEAEANVDIYTAIDMYPYTEDDKPVKELDFNAADVLSNGGFDLSLELERNWFHNFYAGMYTRIPIVPGTLKHKMSTRVWAYFYETNVLGYIDNTEEHGSDHGHDDFSYTDANFKVYRPLKLGFNAVYIPFGDWLKIQPQLGFALRDPYSGNSVFYPEYALDLKLSLFWKVLNFNLGTAYQNQIFQQRFGLSLDFRAVEILAQVSLCGTTLPSSFDRNGYGAFAGVRVGF